MEPEVHIHTSQGHDLDNAMVVVGAPTLGLVGTITTRYLVDKLDLELVGGLHCDRFPPVSLITNGRASLPVRMYAMQAGCGPSLSCDKLVVVTAEFMPGAQLIHRMSEALIRWAMEHQAGALFLPDGLLVEGQEEEAGRILGVASGERARAFLEQQGIELVEEGVVSGLSAALLYDSDRLGLDTVCLLSETAPDHPDARAAARVVEVLDALIPDIEIETAPLIKEAEAIEQQLQALRAQLAQKALEAERVEPGASPSMYQ